MIKKIIKIIIILLILGALGFGGYKVYKYYKGKDQVGVLVDMNSFNENLSTEVYRDDMVSSISFVGSTQIKNQQKLKFNYENRVTGVFKQVGDTVKEGDLIAELDKSEIYSQVEIYKLNVQNAELKLKKLLENTSEIEVKKAQISLDKLKEDLENTKTNLEFLEQEHQNKIDEMEKTLAQKETELRILEAETKVNLSQIGLTPTQKEQELVKSKNNLATLELELERYIRDFELNYNKSEREYYSKIEKEYTTIEESIRNLIQTFNNLDELLQVLPNKFYNNNYSMYYSAKDSNYRNQSKVSFQEAYGLLEELEDQIENLGNKRDIDKLVNLIDIQINMYEFLAIAGEQIMRGLDNSVEGGDFTNSVISSFHGQASSLFSLSNSKVLELKNLPLELRTLKKPSEIGKDMENELQSKKDTIEDLKLSIQKQEDDLGLATNTTDDKSEQESKKVADKKQEIEEYKLSLNKTKVNNAFELQSKRKAIQESELQITETERNLKELLDDNSNQELIFAQNDVKQARISLENENKKLETYELRAPFDGIITKLDYQPGDNLTQNDEKYILLENPDLLEISIFADQVDVMKLSKGQKAIVTYDSFPGNEFQAEIIEIDSTPQDKDGVTKYEVKISLDRGEYTIYSGMNAQVNVIIQEKLGVLTVPFSAINTDPETGEEFVVILKDNGNKEQRKVVTGYSDGVNTEILEGLEEGEKVLGIDYDSNYYKPEDFGDGGGMYY